MCQAVTYVLITMIHHIFTSVLWSCNGRCKLFIGVAREKVTEWYIEMASTIVEGSHLINNACQIKKKVTLFKKVYGEEIVGHNAAFMWHRSVYVAQVEIVWMMWMPVDYELWKQDSPGSICDEWKLFPMIEPMLANMHLWIKCTSTMLSLFTAGSPQKILTVP